MKRKIHFVANGVFSTTIAGGDIHFLKLAEAAAKAGHPVNFFGGHALQQVLAHHKIPATITLTDDAAMAENHQGKLGGQLALFQDYYRRYRRTMRLLDHVAEQDLVYAVSDSWIDVLPVVGAPTHRKAMILHMEAPRLGQILTRSRPDVDALRLASLHYWASQERSLHRFAKCPEKHVFYLHPLMRSRLQNLGVRAEEMTQVSYGLDVAAADAVPAQPRIYDAVWIGRVHRQKGIDDLLETFQFLARRLENFRAVLIGNLRDALLPKIREIGLEQNVTFSGFVSEAEKVRLFKSSCVFLMPSTHEGSPRVIGESILAGTPVVAYEIPNYRPLFGEFVRYAPPFHLAAFQQTAESEIQRMRAGKNYLEKMPLADFRRDNSWETTQAKFFQAVNGD